MGVIKGALCIATGIFLFYSGICYERGRSRETLSALKSRITEMQTLDYKIASLLEAQAKNPKAVEEALSQYENYRR